MPKRKEPELTPQEQFKRFQETAKEHGIEERLPEIERAFDALAANQKKPRKEGGRQPKK
jgi:hypothetical protein